MAIIVEQERTNSSSSIVSALIWLVILGVLAAAAYYIFFKNPVSIDLVLPKTTTALSSIQFNQAIITRAVSLREYQTPTPAVSTGRPNPFLGF